MIEFYKHNDINRESWDRCVADALGTSIFYHYDFLSIANPQWGALILDDYLAVMPLPWRSRFGFRYIYTPFFCMRLGIVSPQSVTPQLASDFVRAIPKDFAQTELVLNELTPTPLFAAATSEMHTHLLSLNRPYEELAAQYSSNHRRNVRAAQNCGLTLETGIAVEKTVVLFTRNRGKDKGIKIKAADYDIFLKMCEYASRCGQLDSWGARDESGDLIAAATFLRDNRKIFFWFSGRDERFAEKRAMFFLIDQYIRSSAGQDLTLDFCGSRNPNIARFYQGFGAQHATYPHLKVTHPVLNPLIKLYKRFR